MVSTLYKCPAANLYFPHVYRIKIRFFDHLYSSSSQQPIDFRTSCSLSSQGGGGGRLLRILIDRDDRRIWGGLKFSISGFFWVGKFWQVFFFYLSRDFLGYLMGTAKQSEFLRI